MTHFETLNAKRKLDLGHSRWVADPANATNATNATYTVQYASGSTPVSVNQTQNGGQWQLLGTFTLDPALNPQVVLSDQANGTVVADAVMVVPSGTSADRVTYTPTLTSGGTIDIYAKWTENANRSDNVTYTIHHSGGSSDILVNQQQPSAGWYHLGTYAMAPGQNHRVEVEGALEGETVADAVRFVSSGLSAPGISYIHADHLGSPQKMTDAAKAMVWDAVYTPFGQVHSITGTATNNQRFPGQYADAETGYSYNYFRDYDPTTGRYVQSDPIGLRGGLNTFGYAGGNPGKFKDPFGLAFIDIPFPEAPPWIPEWVKAAGRRALGPIILILSIPGDTPQCGDDDCEELYSIDTQTCNGITRTRGRAAGAKCHASAADRYAACLAGRDIPPLNTWNN